jgi:hypothetical protein
MILNRERAIMNDWLPVRLAPRDGTPVILWIEDGGYARLPGSDCGVGDR